MKPKNCTGLEKWTEMEDLSCLTPSFGDGTVEYLKRFLSLEYPSIYYCISWEHFDFSCHA